MFRLAVLTCPRAQSMVVWPCIVPSHLQPLSDAMCVFYLNTGHVFSQQSCATACTLKFCIYVS